LIRYKTLVLQERKNRKNYPEQSSMSYFVPPNDEKAILQAYRNEMNEIEKITGDEVEDISDVKYYIKKLKEENEKLTKEIEELKKGVDKTLWRRLYLTEEALSNIKSAIDFVDGADLKNDDAFPEGM
jgi:predicted RNase H-like nuclease (RuvC/YqgF family)